MKERKQGPSLCHCRLLLRDFTVQVITKVKVDLLRCPGLLYVQAPSDIKFLKATMTMLLMVQYQG